MKVSIIAAVSGLAFVICSIGFAAAGPLDGSYISNKRNNLTILGNQYGYRAREGGGSGNHNGSFVSLGGDRYQFRGFLHYTCEKHGTTLVCASGKRSWYKQ
ncbi:MAG TPA: hypothetical protein VHD59_12555 [Pseudolabrys sp.]|nr:hypothetical protein [Pseudolabrys sp.]